MTIDLANTRHVHFVGIGGIGMSALARVLLAWNLEVSGSDRDENDETVALRQAGASVTRGHRPEYIEGSDLVVVSSAIPSQNAEAQEALRRGIPVVKRAELLAAVANRGTGIAIAGTHGKTTTSALIGHILVDADTDPTILIGGIGRDLGSNARVGASDLVVVEADEYDDTFLRLRPSIGVVTNVASEHLDYFGTAEGVVQAFRRFAAGVADTLVVCADDPVASSLKPGPTASVVHYGIKHGEWRARDIEETGTRTTFRVSHEGGHQRHSTILAGKHNVLNALAAMAVARQLEISDQVVARALASFQGVRRRFEYKGEVAGVTVIDDYAVHPTEVKATLRAIKQRFRRPIRVVFQPHTYSRLQSFLPEFSRSFVDADSIYVMDVYAAREINTLGVSGRNLADLLAEENRPVCYVETELAALAALTNECQAGDIVVTMGAGTVTNLGPALLEALAKR